MPPRRPRASISSASGADDVAHLSLPEVRDRLTRNTALLSSPLFASPPSSSSASPFVSSPPLFQGVGAGAGAGVGAGVGVGVAGPGPNTQLALSPTRSISSNTGAGAGAGARGGDDPVRDKLIAAREALLVREQELMLSQMKIEDGLSSSPNQNQYPTQSSPFANANARDNDMYSTHAGGSVLHSPTNGLRRGSADTSYGNGNGNGNINGGRSGKAKVLESIKASESRLARNGLILPIDQTLTLGDRDYQNATTAALSHLSLNPTRSMSPKPRRLNPLSSSISGGGHQSRASGSSLASTSAAASGSRIHASASAYASGGPGEDEIARANRLARMNAFMSYKGSLSEDDDDDFDDEDGDGGDYGRGRYDDDDDDDDMLADPDADADREGEADERGFPPSAMAGGGYDGNALPEREVGLDAMGEEVDEFGEDDEIFAEGNDDALDVDVDVGAEGMGVGTGGGALAPGR